MRSSRQSMNLEQGWKTGTTITRQASDDFISFDAVFEEGGGQTEQPSETIAPNPMLAGGPKDRPEEEAPPLTASKTAEELKRRSLLDAATPHFRKSRLTAQGNRASTRRTLAEKRAAAEPVSKVESFRHAEKSEPPDPSQLLFDPMERTSAMSQHIVQLWPVPVLAAGVAATTAIPQSGEAIQLAIVCGSMILVQVLELSSSGEVRHTASLPSEPIRAGEPWILSVRRGARQHLDFDVPHGSVMRCTHCALALKQRAGASEGGEEGKQSGKVHCVVVNLTSHQAELRRRQVLGFCEGVARPSTQVTQQVHEVRSSGKGGRRQGRAEKLLFSVWQWVTNDEWGLLQTKAAAVGPRDGETVAEGQDGSTATMLDCVGCDLGPVGARAVAHAIAAPHRALSSQASPTSGAALSTSRVGTLTAIDLSGNGLGSIGTSFIAAALSSNRAPRTLTRLGLAHNLIYANGLSRGVQALAAALGGSPGAWQCPLRSLDLSGNSLHGWAAEEIFRSLTTNTVLTSLDLSAQSLRGLGESQSVALALAAAIEANRTLTELDVSENRDALWLRGGLGDNNSAVGGKAVTQAIKANDTLEILQVRRGNNVVQRLRGQQPS